MGVLITFIVIWLFLPVLAELFTNLTTASLLKVSNSVPRFWEVVGGKGVPYDFLGYYAKDPMLMTDNELSEWKTDHPLHTAVEPPKANWK